ncbi:hypothetical protein KA005_77020 [bacterium]|nr:hypothetical protein [bacterium]
MNLNGLWKTEIGDCLMILKYVHVDPSNKPEHTRMGCKVVSGKYNGTGLISVMPKRNITLAVMDTLNDMQIIYVRKRGAQIDYGSDSREC